MLVCDHKVWQNVINVIFLYSKSDRLCWIVVYLGPIPAAWCQVPDAASAYSDHRRRDRVRRVRQ